MPELYNCNPTLKGLILLTLILAQSTHSDDSTSFLVAICDNKHRVYCFGAVLRDTWVVAAPNCAFRHLERSTVTIHAGPHKMRCNSPRVITNSIEMPFDVPELAIELAFFHMPSALTFDKEVSPISFTPKEFFEAVGDVCNVFSYQYRINSTDEVHITGTPKQAEDPNRSEKIDIYKVNVVLCRDTKYICVKLKEDVDIGSSPVVCDGKLLGILWVGGAMPNMVIHTYSKLIIPFMSRTSARANDANSNNHKFKSFYGLKFGYVFSYHILFFVSFVYLLNIFF